MPHLQEVAAASRRRGVEDVDDHDLQALGRLRVPAPTRLATGRTQEPIRAPAGLAVARDLREGPRLASEQQSRPPPERLAGARFAAEVVHDTAWLVQNPFDHVGGTRMPACAQRGRVALGVAIRLQRLRPSLHPRRLCVEDLELLAARVLAPPVQRVGVETAAIWTVVDFDSLVVVAAPPRTRHTRITRGATEGAQIAPAVVVWWMLRLLAVGARHHVAQGCRPGKRHLRCVLAQ